MAEVEGPGRQRETGGSSGTGAAGAGEAMEQDFDPRRPRQQ